MWASLFWGAGPVIVGGLLLLQWYEEAPDGWWVWQWTHRWRRKQVGSFRGDSAQH